MEPLDPKSEALRLQYLLLREAAQKKAHQIEARFQRRLQPLSRARDEFQRNLDHLKEQLATGRYPKHLLAPALLREELRLKQLDDEIQRLKEEMKMSIRNHWLQVRLKAAKMAKKRGVNLDLSEFFPEVLEDESLQKS
ncbi:MAG: hypothetical protein P3W93_006770 [Thermus sp.]|nr:hypothetical protein [Thermus sp.]